MRAWVIRAAAGGAALVAALLLASWPSLTAGSAVVVLLAGLAICAAVLVQPLAERDRRVRPAQWAPWLGVALAVALWELALLLLGNNDSWPPLSRLADPVDQLGAGRFTLTLVWLAAGAWLLRRSRR